MRHYLRRFIKDMAMGGVEVVPGVSASLILVLAGLYARVSGAVTELDLLVLLIVAAGCLVGLLVFSRRLKLAVASLAWPHPGSLPCRPIPTRNGCR
ncbi:undecaprenyl phosphate translocase family protein [Pseudomonas sp. N040]|uniref:undecaprenyl phosphate translocase family protein n=1 Tax=Pseudomonas sp. N040 TaxID=2785325 RepID=UPI001E37377E|nr:DUF368 domain-containing protein [Pseudomonas sp. N040]